MPEKQDSDFSSLRGQPAKKCGICRTLIESGA
jgi:hypothetical protein